MILGNTDSFRPSMTLLDFYEDFYRPARHPGNVNSATCQQFRICIETLARPATFNRWLAENHPKVRRPAPLLYREFCRWHPQNHQRDLQVTVEQLNDTVVIEAMNFMVLCGRSRVTANKMRRHVNAVWHYAVDLGVIENLPKSKPYKVEKSEPVALMPNQLRDILAAAGRQKGWICGVKASDWWPAALLFLYSLGARISAALQIPTKNIDWERGEVIIPAGIQKQRREQRLDLLDSALERLKALQLRERKILTVLGDWPYSANTLRRNYKKILVEAGMFPDVESVPNTYLFHCLRRTLASQLFEKVGIHAACDRLGHSTIEVTKAYIDPRYRNTPKVRELITDPLATV